MALFGSRSNPVARRRSDGSFDLVLAPELRETIGALLGELDELVAEGPGDPSLRRLAPPAYLDDADKDAEYQLLAGDELRSSRQQAIAAVQGSLAKDRLSEDDLWAWLQSLNALRLVVGTRLGIDDDHHEHDPDAEGPDAGLWSIYDFATWLQYSVLKALGG
ncbi:DUF2017 domain-containing protein [Aquihabitans sp. G128]|uniref:DUF2017 family protein n=1 Tax=Aquihabitans sp. G128 TaxID=2849779 RepID=UPI001C24D21C|nr:DUF2017 family protein [Aquihabitans sp. G128]QXC59493.1 DUF2017 domain-containing protein [Aquihabitans sp. G128]